MNTTFGLYGRYYDLLYQDKDYRAEADCVRGLIERFHANPKEILELGCGTGKHARLLADAGWRVVGVERSQAMIDAAGKPTDRVSIVSGDARSVRLGKEFDAVVSLFHVVSYQATNADVAAMFDTAAIHLRPGGCFLFDVWYGPAVLTQLPEPRLKQMENDQTSVVRRAQPTVDFQRNLVDVEYEITVSDKRTGATEELQECHRMRYFFVPEIKMFAQAAGLEMIHCEQWLTGDPPSPESWGVAFVLQKPS